MEITDQWLADNGATLDQPPDEIRVWSVDNDQQNIVVARVGTVVHVGQYTDLFGVGLWLMVNDNSHDHDDVATAQRCVANAVEGFRRIDTAEAVGGDAEMALNEYERELIASGAMTYPKGAGPDGPGFQVI